MRPLSTGCAADLGIYDDAERARLSDLLAELPAEEWPDDTGAERPSRRGRARRPGPAAARGHAEAAAARAQAVRGAQAGQAQPPAPAAAGARS